jgi:hypothetical protein
MIPFIPQGSSAVVAYADDSTDTHITLNPGSFGVPNCLYVVNNDAANVVVVNYSFVETDTNAVVPTSGANGVGVVIGSKSAVQIRIDSTYQGGPLYVSAAGVSGSGNVYVSPGVL